MRREYIFICSLTCLLFPLLSERVLASAETRSDYSRGCAHLRCENGSRCVKRRFWCKDPPCPGMLYCSKSRKESLRGPLTCDTVRCNEGHVCIVKVRGCHWDEKCKQQLARCVSEKEYYEGAASCAGVECPSGKRCILRETHCVNPPCQLVRSCESAEDVKTWFEKCKNLDCVSEYECFLRRPENCLDSRCTHTPDCTFTIEDELISKYCYGWICPRAQKCVVRIVDSCKGFDCIIERSCRTSSVSSTKRSTNNEPISLVISTRKENIHHTTSTKREMTHRQIATTKSNLVRKFSESSTNEPDLTLPYSRSRLNYNKFSTIDENKVFQSSTISLTISPTNAETESTISRDTQRLEEPRKIYITTDDVLPLPTRLEDINFFGQGYPIWIKNPYYLLQVKDEKSRYYAPQEPYKILLPPYEPVILVEDTRRQEQFPPFLTDDFDRLFDEAALIPLPEVTPIDDKTDNHTNSSIVEMANIRTNYSDDLSDNHESFPEKLNTAPPSVRDKELDNFDNYEWVYDS